MGEDNEAMNCEQQKQQECKVAPLIISDSLYKE